MVMIVTGLPAFTFARIRSSGFPAGLWRLGSRAIVGSSLTSSIVYEWAASSRQYHHLPNQKPPSLEGALPVLGSIGLDAGVGRTGTRSRQGTTILRHSVLSSGNATS